MSRLVSLVPSSSSSFFRSSKNGRSRSIEGQEEEEEEEVIPLYYSLSSPQFVTIDDRSHRLFVSDQSNHCIQVFHATSFEWICQLGQSGCQNGQFYAPCGLAIDSNRSVLYVVDQRNHRIQLFDTKSLQFITSFGQFGCAPGHFSSPIGIHIDSKCESGDFRIYVVDSQNYRVQVFNRDLEYLFSIGGSQLLSHGGGSCDLPMNSAWGVTVVRTVISQQVRVMVSDVQSHSIQVFTDEGQFLFRFGTKGRSRGQFVHPCGITATNSGEVLVCDRFNCRVQVFDAENGSFLAEYSPGLSLLHGPCAIHYHSDAVNERVIVGSIESSSIQVLDYRSNRWPYRRLYTSSATAAVEAATYDSSTTAVTTMATTSDGSSLTAAAVTTRRALPPLFQNSCTLFCDVVIVTQAR